jgi:hypothetical protein
LVASRQTCSGTTVSSDKIARTEAADRRLRLHPWLSRHHFGQRGLVQLPPHSAVGNPAGSLRRLIKSAARRSSRVFTSADPIHEHFAIAIRLGQMPDAANGLFQRFAERGVGQARRTTPPLASLAASNRLARVMSHTTAHAAGRVGGGRSEKN